jgi:hypothetical protein
VNGHTLCLADGEEGLKVFDLSTPGFPVLLSAYPGGNVLNVDQSEDFVYLADEREGIRVIDLEDRTRPLHFATYETRGATCVATLKDHAYAADGRIMYALHVVVQGTSRRIASCEIGGSAYRIVASGSRAYVAGHRTGVAVVDMSDPLTAGEKSLVTSYATGFAADVAMLGSYLLVADGVKGIKIIDTITGEVQALFTGGEANGLSISGSLVLVADRQGGTKIFDLSDPRRPVELGTIETPDARDAELQNSIAYVADGQLGLSVFDLSDPSQPVPLATLGDMEAMRLAWRRQRLYVVSRAGLHIVDVSSPANPLLLGLYASPYAEDVVVAPPYAYLAEGYKGLTVLDVSRPAKPLPVSTCSDIYAVGLAVDGEYAWVTNSTELQIVHILIPEWLKRSTADEEE